MGVIRAAGPFESLIFSGRVIWWRIIPGVLPGLHLSMFSFGQSEHSASCVPLPVKALG